MRAQENALALVISEIYLGLAFVYYNSNRKRELRSIIERNGISLKWGTQLLRKKRRKSNIAEKKTIYSEIFVGSSNCLLLFLLLLLCLHSVAKWSTRWTLGMHTRVRHIMRSG